MFDLIMLEYIRRHGWRIDAGGLLVLTVRQFREYQYTGRSVSVPARRTLMISGAHGCVLLIEEKHFKIREV